MESNSRTCLFQVKADHPRGWIVHLSGWDKMLENIFPHIKGHCVASTDSADGAMRAALPVFDMKSRLLSRKRFSIHFSTLSVPFVTFQRNMYELLEIIFDVLKQLKTSYLEVRFYNASELMQDTGVDCLAFYKHHFLFLTKEIDGTKKSLNSSLMEFKEIKSRHYISL